MPEATTPLPARVSTPLLALVTQESLDEDYQHVADRRGTPAPTGRVRPRRTAAIVVGFFGLLVTVAAVQTSEDAGVQDASRAALTTQIDDRRAEVARLQERIVQGQEDNIGLQDRLDALTARERAAVDRATRLGVVTGFEAVTGPGVRISVDDAPGGSALVQDKDLRPLVNGLWQAGAEAVAINGQRITARTAIRNSGVAIRVNNRSLSPPYVVTAIGDPRTLQANLAETTGGLTFRSIVEGLGFPTTMDNVDELSLPAAPSRLLRLRSAVAATGSSPDEKQGSAPGSAQENRNRKEMVP